MESQGAISRIRAELQRGDSEALRNVATCRAVLHNRVSEVCRNLPYLTESVVGFDAGVSIAKPRQTEDK